MQIEELRVDDVTILRLKGRLELEEGDVTLRDHVNNLVNEGRVKLVLDMREVTRLDSAGIGMLVSKFLTARRRGGAIKLIHLTNRSEHLMDITRLSTVFEIFQDEDEALRSFGVVPASGV
jgi:anti-sigma B factor antagonist